MTAKTAQNQQMKAIPAAYKGVKFRSRLEARYAVFFDAIGVRWLYEYEGYQLPGGWYVPDFLLPEQNTWLEVKPFRPSGDEESSCRELADATGRDTYLFYGELLNPHESSNGIQCLAWFRTDTGTFCDPGLGIRLCPRCGSLHLHHKGNDDGRCPCKFAKIAPFDEEATLRRAFHTAQKWKAW